MKHLGNINDNTDIITKEYLETRVKTDVPTGAKFTDTVIDIADNLTTDDATKALSAKQGKILDEKSPNKEFYVPHSTKTNHDRGNAEGYQTTASGSASHAEGDQTTASGEGSHAEGTYTTASEYASHAEGVGTTASGHASHAEGGETFASGSCSHAQNEGTIAQGGGQTAIGHYNIPQGTTFSHLPDDHAFIIGNGDGYGNRSNALTVNWQGDVDIAGDYKIAGEALYSKAEIDNKVKTDVPAGAKFTDTNTVTSINGKTGTILKADIVALGIPAQDTNTTYTAGTNIAITGNTISATDTVVDVSGKADKTYVDNKVKTDVPTGAKFTDTVIDIADNLTTDDATKALSAKQGKILDEKSPNKEFYVPHDTETNHATGNAEGDQTTASGEGSHAEGTYTTASEYASHAEGVGTTASGHASHAEGGETFASGMFSHAQNEGTIAQGETQTAIGRYNIPQGTTFSHLPDDHAFIIGNGDGYGNRSNALTVNWQGDVDIAGNFSGGIGNYTEKIQATTGTINLSLANVFTDTPSANRTYSITNAVSGQAHSFTLMITQTATVRTITFPASVKWQGGDTPDMTTASKVYVLTFLSTDGGTTWLGMFGGEF